MWDPGAVTPAKLVILQLPTQQQFNFNSFVFKSFSQNIFLSFSLSSSSLSDSAGREKTHFSLQRHKTHPEEERNRERKNQNPEFSFPITGKKRKNKKKTRREGEKKKFTLFFFFFFLKNFFKIFFFPLLCSALVNGVYNEAIFSSQKKAIQS